MSDTKEYNRINQEKYYKSNSERVLKLRAMRKIKNFRKLNLLLLKNTFFLNLLKPLKKRKIKNIFFL